MCAGARIIRRGLRFSEMVLRNSSRRANRRGRPRRRLGARQTSTLTYSRRWRLVRRKWRRRKRIATKHMRIRATPVRINSTGHVFMLNAFPQGTSEYQRGTNTMLAYNVKWRFVAAMDSSLLQHSQELYVHHYVVLDQ
ncbi:Geminivirus AR1/BR1 coat protein [Parasponia andersonii]|uniref:Geminivirus AR1/BR1 coat protein n=1 Tax=Parasponia andersonii TaxID=3476 RepID=A0A2P5DBF9_PARAD|nr:Geminivirus AR1/BR1 coat protein [Parasponia andersonii]